MKLVLIITLSFLCLYAFSQEKEFLIEAQIIDSNQNSLNDVYVLNYRNLDKTISNENGIFGLWVLPEDSLMISHISYHRKIIHVFELLKNPVIQIDIDTINILEVNIFSRQKTDSEKAMENIKSIEFDLRPQPGESFTEKEMVQDMLNRENGIMRSEATSLNIISFSPTFIFDIIASKVKRRKKANQFYSQKKKSKKNYSDSSK